jgi:iron only hydrogenase large subunit-like protein
MQSHHEVLDVLSQNPPSGSQHKVPVLSISPQSLASLAASIPLPLRFESGISSNSIPLRTVLHRIRAFCKSKLRFEHIFDTTFARHLALLEHAQEFAERKRDATSSSYMNGDTKEGVTGRLPMLASACPGWVCYAEKTHAEMLPFISRTKSPQQVMGTLVKNWLGSRWEKT